MPNLFIYMSDKCIFKYNKKYLNMDNQERMQYNKHIRESLELLESIKHEISEDEYKIINQCILKEIRYSN